MYRLCSAIPSGPHRSGFTCEAREEKGSTKIKRPVKRVKRDPIPSDLASPEQRKQMLQLNASRASPQFQSHSPGQSQGSYGSLSERQRFGANSSAVSFVARIFGFPSSDISSISGRAGRSKVGCAGPPWSMVTMPCPSPVLLEALIDAYLDRMHWFTLFFTNLPSGEPQNMFFPGIHGIGTNSALSWLV